MRLTPSTHPLPVHHRVANHSRTIESHPSHPLGVTPASHMTTLQTSDRTALRTLSTADLFREVHALAPRTAVFDCDGTLWSGDAGSTFMRWSIESGLVSRETSDRINERYRGYIRGDVSELAICGEMVQIYAGLRIDEMRSAARTFFARFIEPNIFPEMLQLIQQLQSAGVDIWAVSSTNDWVIEEGVTRFGIPANRVLAACVTCQNGLIGNQLRDVPTDGGKVDALRAAGIPAPDAVFGNSVHDAAMLGIARQAFPVNPSPELIERSRREGWPVYFPGSVQPPRSLA